jgi:prepilin-type N-terminal cleavage/methylation domain-containing protein
VIPDMRQRTCKNFRHSAFTLIELLIVVAIIAVLAAIAVPNFLEAQIRAKVARCKADMRTLATALESYHVDNGRYPETYVNARWERFFPLTTPIAYLSTVPEDLFHPKDEQGDVGIDWGPRNGAYKMGATPLETPSRWAIAGDGPDRDEDSLPIKLYPGFSWSLFLDEDASDAFTYMIYDPTNGIVSNGDLWRCSDYNR